MKATAAHLKRTLTPGTRVRITNHRRPTASRDTRITHRTNTIGFYTWWINHDGKLVEGRTLWPKAADISADSAGAVFHIGKDGQPFITIEVIGDDHPDAASWPDTTRPI